MPQTSQLKFCSLKKSARTKSRSISDKKYNMCGIYTMEIFCGCNCDFTIVVKSSTFCHEGYKYFTEMYSNLTFFSRVVAKDPPFHCHLSLSFKGFTGRELNSELSSLMYMNFHYCILYKLYNTVYNKELRSI